MKTDLTAADLMIIHNVLVAQLRICNISDGYKNNCKAIAIKISDSLGNINVDINEKRQTKAKTTKKRTGIRSGS